MSQPLTSYPVPKPKPLETNVAERQSAHALANSAAPQSVSSYAGNATVASTASGPGSGLGSAAVESVSCFFYLYEHGWWTSNYSNDLFF
jgi:hypothetical protein